MNKIRHAPKGLRYIALRLLALAVVDAFASWFLYLLTRDRAWPLATAIIVVTLGVNIVNLRTDLYPLRWLSPGLVLLILMALYPIIFTVYTAFTNYSDGHLFTKQQAIRLLAKEQYLSESAPIYRWTAFRSPNGEYALWLMSEDGQAFLARPGEAIQEGIPGESGVGALDEEGIPQSIEGYERLSRANTVRFIPEIGALEFGQLPDTIKVSSLDKAAQYQQRYVYDEARDAIVDSTTGKVYRADETTGTFISSDGEALIPGYQVPVGLRNFKRLFTNPALRGPFGIVFLWTFEYALLAAFTTFVLGLFLALVFNDPIVPGRKLISSLLIIPYAIPSAISILIWRGMLSPQLGVISINLERLFGWSPAWRSDPGWTRVAVLLINLWLGYPYMMLVCSGALQSIPQDLYEVAEVDGANAWQRFRYITLPLLLVSVGPLLVASFVFNFNNFNPIYLFNEGGPPIPGATTPAGYTDILISYTYRLAFAGQRGADYGYAAAITITIFIMLSLITVFSSRYTTRAWEEVSENA